MIELSIDRTSLSLSPLVIPSDPFVGRLHIPEDGVTWPWFDTRREYMPDSAWVPGRGLLAAVQGSDDWPLTIYAHGDSTTDLDIGKAELAAALAQFKFDVTLTVDSVARTYHAECVLDIPWGVIDSGMVRAHMARASFSIPLNP